MQLKKQLLSVATTGALLLNIVTPVGAASLIIQGNGTDSDNNVKLSLEQTTTVVQSNEADVKNDIDASADTGNNSASDNTSGDVNVETGDAKSDVKVANTLNSNSAEVDCCAANDLDVLISENGSDSENEVELGVGTQTFVGQYNEADVDNDVDADADTGDNDADDNTGGDVKVKTGNATTKVDLSTTANANWAKVGSSGEEGGSVSLRIIGNGSGSDNDIVLGLEKSLELVQSNEADVDNDVDADADTGNNSADDNTGGNAEVDTGDALVDVEVDNMANFNWADVDCGGCLLDVLAKVAENGSDTENEIEAELADELGVFQDNCGESEGLQLFEGHGRHDCELDNDIYADADTGDNDADDNTDGGHGGDPSVTTGDADALVDVENSGNSNVYGSGVPSDWPDFEFNFNISLSWAQLMALLGN
jgi:hypothetical protein